MPHSGILKTMKMAACYRTGYRKSGSFSEQSRGNQPFSLEPEA